MRVVQVQHSFSGGEVSPLIHQARSDSTTYRSSLVKCHNYVPLPQGALTRRPSISNIDQCSRVSDGCRSIMIACGSQILIIQHEKTFVWSDLEFSFSQKKTIWKTEDLDEIRHANFKSALILVHPKYPPFVFINGEFEFFTPSAGPYLSLKKSDTIENKNKLTITKDYGVRQSVHVGTEPSRASQVPWWAWPIWGIPILITEAILVPAFREEVEESIFSKRPIYKDDFGSFEHTLECEQGTFKESDVGRHITFICDIPEWNKDTKYSKGAFFISSNGYIYEIKEVHEDKNVWDRPLNKDDRICDMHRYVVTQIAKAEEHNKICHYYGIITQVDSKHKAFVAMFDKPVPFCGKATTDRWELGVWNSQDGYPGIVSVHNNRVIFSGYSKYPTRVDMSEIVLSDTIWDISFKPTNVRGDIIPTSSISFTIDTIDRGEKVQWICGYNNKLLIGTDQREWECGSLGERGIPTGFLSSPLNFTLNCISSYGSENIPPIMVGRSLVFVQKGGQSLQQISIVEKYQYKMTDLLFLSGHLVSELACSFNSFAHIVYPYSILWSSTKDHRLLGCTIDTEHSILAWHTHSLGDKSSVHSVVSVNGHVYLLLGIADKKGKEISSEKLEELERKRIKLEVERDELDRKRKELNYSFDKLKDIKDAFEFKEAEEAKLLKELDRLRDELTTMQDIFEKSHDEFKRFNNYEELLFSTSGLYLARMQPFSLDGSSDNFKDNGHRYTSEAILPRIEERLENTTVGGYRRIVSSQIKCLGNPSLQLGCVGSELVTPLPKDGIIKGTLTTSYGRNEELRIIQDDAHPGTILQALMVAEVSNAQ